jgi:hypothetical protein
VLLLILLVVVALVALVGAVGGAAASKDDAERSFLGGAGPPLILLAGGGAVVVIGLAAVLLVGVRGGGDGDHDEAAAAVPPTTSAPARPTPVPPPADQEPAPATGLPAATGPEVTITSGGPPGVVDRLPERAVLVVSAEGFEPGTGKVAQCGLGPGGAQDCVNGFPVEFSTEGTARVQYLVSDRVHDGERCGTGQRSCLLVIFGADGEPLGLAFTVFHDPAPPPGRVTVEPRDGLAGGDLVTITGTGFPAATQLVVAQCPVGVELLPGDCRRAEPVRTGPDGVAVVRFKVHTGEVDGVACGPREACAIRVTAEAPVAPVTLAITFSAGPSAGYHGGRLAVGLALAALLLALGWYLLRTTDWREPAAASTPEMDQAVLDA